MPNEKIIMGRLARPHGICGWVKVISFTDPIENLLNYRIWQIRHYNAWQIITLQNGKTCSSFLIVKLKGIENPESAKFYTNDLIAIEREALPSLNEDEYYWFDLIGLHVTSIDGFNFGTVTSLVRTNLNDVLIVKSRDRERMIPYVSRVIKSVNMEKSSILVDWGADF